MTMKAIKDTRVRVKVDIQPGPVPPAQRQLQKRFWAKLLSQSKDALKSEDEVKASE